MERAFGVHPRKRRPLRRGGGCDWTRLSGALTGVGLDPQGLGGLSSESGLCQEGTGRGAWKNRQCHAHLGLRWGLRWEPEWKLLWTFRQGGEWPRPGRGVSRAWC